MKHKLISKLTGFCFLILISLHFCNCNNSVPTEPANGRVGETLNAWMYDAREGGQCIKVQITIIDQEINIGEAPTFGLITAPDCSR
jgi:hypothetical protein